MKKISTAIISMLLFVTPLLTFAQTDDYGTTQTMFCPQISQRLMRGDRDSNTNGQVSQLQIFLKDYRRVRARIIEKCAPCSGKSETLSFRQKEIPAC